MSNFKKTYTLPFKFEIPNYIKEFLNNRSLVISWIKFSKRFLFIFFKGQKNLEVFSISPKHQSILWINISASSYGDTLMDLSSRVLLKDRKLDLFITKKNVQLYTDDNIFNNVYSSESSIDATKYDLIIVDSFSTRSFNIKTKVASKTNFVSMFGFFNGPEVNRVLFSFHQMNNLLGYKMSEGDINSCAKASMSISKIDQDLVEKINLPNNYIAIVLGGEWGYRTYNDWDKVVAYILKVNSDINIVLLGSDNAKVISKKLFLQFANNNIFNHVAMYSFNQTAQIIKQADLVLCCDGGLMHTANIFNKTVIPLFARLSPKMQLTDCINAFPLFDKDDVNNISVEAILEKYHEAVSFFDNHPQGE